MKNTIPLLLPADTRFENYRHHADLTWAAASSNVEVCTYCLRASESATELRAYHVVSCFWVAVCLFSCKYQIDQVTQLTIISNLQTVRGKQVIVWHIAFKTLLPLLFLQNCAVEMNVCPVCGCTERSQLFFSWLHCDHEGLFMKCMPQ